MSHDRRRTEKVARLLRVELSTLLLERVKDPRLEGITITDVRVSSDLSVATVYFAVGVEEGAGRHVVEGLDRAAAFLRKELGAKLRLRKTPELRFRRDDALETGLRVDAVLKGLREEER